MSRFRLNTALPWLSWSQVSAYTQCPAKWWFSRRFPPERTPSGLKFGSAIHRALERFYTAAAAGRHAGMDELLAVYLDRWEEPSDAPIQFKEEETPETLKAMAERMLAAFLETVRPGKILAVEEPFTVEVDDGLLVSGIADLVEVKDGRLWIVDNKTAKHSPADAFDKEQIALYRLGLEELGIIPEGMPIGLRYDILRKLRTKGEVVSIEVEVAPKELDDLRQKLGAVRRAVDDGIVFRSRSWACDGCQWADVCARADLAALVTGNERPHTTSDRGSRPRKQGGPRKAS